MLLRLVRLAAYVSLGLLCLLVATAVFLYWPSIRPTQVASQVPAITEAAVKPFGRKHLRLLVIHGIGTHCVGYSQKLVHGILRNLRFDPYPSIEDRLETAYKSLDEAVREIVDKYDSIIDVQVANNSDLHKTKLSWNDKFEIIAQSISNNGYDRETEHGPALKSLTQVFRGLSDTIADLEYPLPVILNHILVLVKYGFAYPDCAPGSNKDVAPDDSYVTNEDTEIPYNVVDNSRINTCQILFETARKDEVTCLRLKLSFFGQSHVSDFLERQARTVNQEEFLKDLWAGCEYSDPCIEIDDYELGFLSTATYSRRPYQIALPVEVDGYDKITVYELTWDPATRWAKAAYTIPDRVYENERDLLNRLIKSQVVNNSISDAVMYLGTSKPLIQFPLLMAFCKMLTDSLHGREDPTKAETINEFRCGARDLGEFDGAEFIRSNDVVVITHSLGTRLFFDTLGVIARDAFSSEVRRELAKNFAYISELGFDAIQRHAGGLKKSLMGGLSKVYALTNQVPLLELSSLSRPYRWPAEDDRDLGRGVDDFLRERVEYLRCALAEKPRDCDKEEGTATGELSEPYPLHVVAFTDHNDPLSYDLKCWYQKHVLRWSTEAEDILAELGDVPANDEKAKTEADKTKRALLESIDDCLARDRQEEWGGALMQGIFGESSEPLTWRGLLDEELRDWWIEAKAGGNAGNLMLKGAAVFNVASKESELPENIQALREVWRRRFARMLLDEIWQAIHNRVRIYDVPVRISTLKFRGLLSHPHEVHSNYFKDEVIHRAIACGWDGGKPTQPCPSAR